MKEVKSCPYIKENIFCIIGCKAKDHCIPYKEMQKVLEKVQNKRKAHVLWKGKVK